MLVSILSMKFSSATLAYFLAICREKGFSQAADKLDKSQSAISTQIGLLEKELGVKLFDRSKRPLLITEAGQLFLEFARDVLNKTEDLERYVSELSTGIAGEVRIGASTSVGTYILPSIISQLLRKFPEVKVSLSTQPRSLVFESVRHADVDFGLVLSDKPPNGLESRTLKAERLCLFTSSNHALARKKWIQIADLESIPFVVGPKGTEYTEMISRILTGYGLSDHRVAARISNFEGVKAVVHAGFGVGLLPHFMIRREIRERALQQLKVQGFNASATIMRIERIDHLATPTILRVKDFFSSAILRL
ncbi:MAG: LysR family transcriptional regulator [Deltaproteobacteria bacterium]|nr:LysR family transcriptional regulator [Deltaproteobacteria bacterium]